MSTHDKKYLTIGIFFTVIGIIMAMWGTLYGYSFNRLSSVEAKQGVQDISNTDIKTYYRQKWLVGYIITNQHPKYEVSLKGGVTLTLDRDKLVTLSPLSPKSRKEEIRKGVVKEWMDKIEYNEVC